MKSRLLALGLLALFAACTTNNGGGNATIVGAHDLFLMDQLPGDGTVAQLYNADGGAIGTGITNQFLFITSTDTNELRVLQMTTPGITGHKFVRAPNPLESLSIPVVDRPQILTGDVGQGADGLRVTGAYVYTASVGGSQISVVDADPSALIQLTPSPIPVGAPITAMAGWMGAGLTTLPATTTLYFSTYDGDVGVLWALKLPMSGADRVAKVQAARPTPVLDLPKETIVSMQVVPPNSVRTVDQAPFCAGATGCIAIATRQSAGTSGRSLLIELDTLRATKLAFPGPVRQLAVVPSSLTLYSTYIYGVLDEEKCDATSCGGVIGVDTSAGTSAGGFPLVKDFTGNPMRAMSVSALPRGLVLAEGVDIAQAVLPPDGGLVQPGTILNYPLLGMFSDSAGVVVPFDGVSAIPIDYDGRRPAFLSAQFTVPAPLPDGGYAFFSDDGGVSTFKTGSASTVGTAENALLISEATLFHFEMGVDAGGFAYAADGVTKLCDFSKPQLHVDVADGYLLAQFMRLTYQGVLPGLDTLATTNADGTTLAFPNGYGYEARLETGDRVLFGQLELDGGVDSCGEARVTGIDAGSLQVDAVPASCGNRVAYTVRAAGNDPLVLTGVTEGYMGRTAPGGTITYNKVYLVQPFDRNRGTDQALPLVPYAMKLTADGFDDGTCLVPGAYWEIYLNGYLSPYKIAFDTSLCSATANYVPGKLVMAYIPQYVNTGTTTHYWKTFTMYPATNGVMEGQNINDLDEGVALAGYSNAGAYCWR